MRPSTLAERLEQNRDERQRFLVDVAHELRTPLTTIVGYGELLADGQLAEPEQVANAGRATHTEATRLHRMVDDLLVLARLDAGELIVESDTVDLAAIASDVAERLESLASKNGLSITSSGSGPAWLRGDAHRLVQILDNLATNAIAFADQVVTLEVRVSRSNSTGATVESSHQNGEVTCVVTDDGPGLGGRGNDVFERLVSDERSDRHRSGSAGVGLDIVSRLAAAMGGRVRVSDSTAGAKFEVSFPSVPAPRALSDEADASLEAPSPR